jgi:hypothetical protein
MALHWPFGHLQPKLWAKEGPGVKLNVTPSKKGWSCCPPLIACIPLGFKLLYMFASFTNACCAFAQVSHNYPSNCNYEYGVFYNCDDA